MNGLAIIEKTDTETKRIFIDQDTIEFARLNAKTTKRVKKDEAARKARQAKKEEARRMASIKRNIAFILLDFAIIGGVALAGTAEIVDPFTCILAGGIALGMACLRFWELFGRGGSK